MKRTAAAAQKPAANVIFCVLNSCSFSKSKSMLLTLYFFVTDLRIIGVSRCF